MWLSPKIVVCKPWHALPWTQWLNVDYLRALSVRLSLAADHGGSCLKPQHSGDRQRKDQEFKVSLGNKVRPCLEQQTQRKKDDSLWLSPRSGLHTWPESPWDREALEDKNSLDARRNSRKACVREGGWSKGWGTGGASLGPPSAFLTLNWATCAFCPPTASHLPAKCPGAGAGTGEWQMQELARSEVCPQERWSGSGAVETEGEVSCLWGRI